jgi:hypothetical protein
MDNSDSLTDLMELRSLISISCCPCLRQAGCPASVRASRATPYGLPCVSPLIPREPTCRFWQFLLGQVLQPSSKNQRVSNSSFSLTRLPIGSLSLQPAGLLDSLIEPLPENLVLQVTLHTSLVLRRRTAEFLRLDFNQSYDIHGMRLMVEIIGQNHSLLCFALL